MKRFWSVIRYNGELLNCIVSLGAKFIIAFVKKGILPGFAPCKGQKGGVTGKNILVAKY
jgi:hypothetical protein